MDGAQPVTPRRRLPGGLLGALALVVVVELLVAGHDRFGTDAALCWRENRAGGTEGSQEL